MTDLAHFELLTSLVGQWAGQATDGHMLRVRYSMHAKDSVLMEHWDFRSTDALTLYHMDGDRLMATHYCPLCNQPRLDLANVNGSRFRFVCVGATNLINAVDAHQHAFEIEILGNAHFWRSESYIAAGKITTEGVNYVRDQVIQPIVAAQPRT